MLQIRIGELRLLLPGVLVAVVLVAITVIPFRRLGSEFMPPLREGTILFMPTTVPGVSIAQAREIMRYQDSVLASFPEVHHVFGKMGRAETSTDPAPLPMVETTIMLKPREHWRPGVTTATLKQELNELVNIPGMTNAWGYPIKIRIDMLATGIKTPVGIKVAGPDLEVIQAIGQQLETLLGRVTGTASVYSERVAGGRYIKVDIDREKAARYGLNIADVQQVIATAIGGMNITQTVEGLERYPVNVRYPQAFRDSPEHLAGLPVVTPPGQRIALGDVAKVFIEDGPPGIKSENARLNGWTFVDLEQVDVGSYVDRARSFVEENIALPPGYSITWSGQYEYMERARQRLAYVVPLTLAIIVVLLYMSFRNFAQVAILMGALPLALVGSVWLMYWFEYNFSIAVGVGVIALAGVVVNDSLILIDFVNKARAEGMAAELTYRTIFALVPVVVLGLGMFRIVGGLDEIQNTVENQLYSFFGVPEIPEEYMEPRAESTEGVETPPPSNGVAAAADPGQRPPEDEHESALFGP